MDIPKFKIAIIDGDPIAYSCCYAVESKEIDEVGNINIICEPIKNMYYNINSMVRKTLKMTGAETYKIYLTPPGKDNFRFDIFPEYKANRKDTRKPIYIEEARDYLIKRWNAEVTNGQEADDACSVLHYRLGNISDIHNPLYNISVLCSIDKDFNNCAGWHFNYRNNNFSLVSSIQALYNFYLQILTGDSSDGIPRIKKGWRQAETEKKLKEAKTELDMCQIVREELGKICDKGIEEINKQILWRGQCLWLRREANELWQLPKERSLQKSLKVQQKN